MKTRQEDAAFGCVGMLSREEDVYNHGLTKRELFASMAMQGILANPERIGGKDQELTQYSVMLADALINELNKQYETD